MDSTTFIQNSPESGTRVLRNAAQNVQHMFTDFRVLYGKNVGLFIVYSSNS